MVLQYGTELLLDSVIKIILYLVLGGILGKTKETLFALLTWCVIRKQTGGRHVKNNFICFVISGSVIFSSVMIGSVLNITLKMLAISVIILNLIYMAYAPYDEYFNEKEGCPLNGGQPCFTNRGNCDIINHFPIPYSPQARLGE